MKKPYRFTHRRGRNIEVCFASQPGRWISCKTANRTEALQFALEIYKRGQNGKLEVAELLKEIQREDFQELREYFNNHTKAKRDVYFKNLACIIEKYLAPLFKTYTLEKLTNLEIEKSLARLDVNNLTKNRILQALKVIFKFANLKGYTDRRLENLEPYWYVPKEKETFTKEELGQLMKLENFTSALWFLYFSILRDTGWRPCEVASLRYTDIKENGGVATCSSVVYNGRKAELQNKIKTTYKGQRYKIGVLSRATLELFEGLDKGTDSLIFVFEDSLLLTQKANRELEKACQRAKLELKGRTQYSFRHTFNTENYYKLDDKTRLELMGHTGERKEYLHLTIEQRLKNLLSNKRAIEILGA